VILALTGCNPLLGIGDPTLAPPDASTPSCRNGWTYHAPVIVENMSGVTLTDYQVMVTLDTQSLIAAGKLSADARDLTFTSLDAEGPLALQIESGLNSRATVVWLSVPAIPPGDSSLAMYYGNASAVAATRSPFVDGIITNPSFETFGGWTLDANVGNTILAQADTGWSTDGAASLFMDEEVNGDRTTSLYTTLVQNVTFPEGADYVIRLDLEVLAASNGGPSDSADFFIDLGKGLDYVWQLGAPQNITGLHLENETIPFGPGSVPLAIGVTVSPGHDHGYAKGYFDNLRVRKHVSPEPVAQVGAEAPCP